VNPSLRGVTEPSDNKGPFKAKKITPGADSVTVQVKLKFDSPATPV